MIEKLSLENLFISCSQFHHYCVKQRRQMNLVVEIRCQLHVDNQFVSISKWWSLKYSELLTISMNNKIAYALLTVTDCSQNTKSAVKNWR